MLFLKTAYRTISIDAAFEDLGKAWRERSHICIDVLTDGRRTYVDQEDAAIRQVPYKMNDLYLFSENMRRIFFNERIIRFGELVFGDRVVGCGSLTFERGSQQPAHVDHVYMTPTPTRRLIASWVACEDIDPDTGPLLFWPGSHRLPPYNFGATRYHYSPEQENAHTQYLNEQKERFPQHEFLGKKGDVLIWHALLIHGGNPIRNFEHTRKSMAFHYFSQECIGRVPTNVQSHGSALYFTKT
jgi:phytanoyl-CoA hydroxylase